MIGTKSMTFVARTTLCILIILITPFVAQAAVLVRDPQALAVLAQCGAAMGAASIQDTYATGTLTTEDPAVPAAPITSQTKGAAERFDISSASGNQTYVLNGGSSWAVRESTKELVPYALSAYHRPEHSPALACVLDVGNSNMSFVYVGQEKFLNTTVHHIRIFVPAPADDNTDSMISEINVFIDRGTLIVLKTEGYVFDPEAYQNHSVWATYYSDYRTVGTALMPFHIENYLDGHKVRDVKFNSAQINVGIADTEFQNPN
jgi:hypothetical protein